MPSAGQHMNLDGSPFDPKLAAKHIAQVSAMSPTIRIGAGSCEERVTEPDRTCRGIPMISRV
jgi:hypothetical protein